jgi:hypothetical protein
MRDTLQQLRGAKLMAGSVYRLWIDSRSDGVITGNTNRDMFGESLAVGPTLLVT